VGDEETRDQIASIEAKMFDIPNIDWSKAEDGVTYELFGFSC
jgi:hypothetical protein